MSESTTDGSTWIRRFHPAPDAAARLVCFPHAGGSASFFFPLSRHLAPAVEVLSVQYPGRQDRRSEENLTNLGEMADQVAEALHSWAGRPLALFGHSMGATLAYEVARRLEAAGHALDALLVSGRKAPHRVVDDGLHLLSDREIVDDIMALDGTGEQMLGDREMLEMMLPSIRADYRAAETYAYRPGTPLECPIHALTGFADPRVAVGELHHWSSHTRAAFGLQVYSGGHFYLTEQHEAIAYDITNRLAVGAVR